MQLFKISFLQSLSIITLVMIWSVPHLCLLVWVCLWLVSYNCEKNVLIHCVILFKEIFKVVFTNFYISICWSVIVSRIIFLKLLFKISMLRDSTVSKFILKSFLLLKNSDSCTNILIPLPLRFFLV